jgi:hypothetical protein
MSALPSGSAAVARLAPEKRPEKPKTQGYLHIERHGGGPRALYIVKYHRLEPAGPPLKPVLAEGAQALIDLLERIGVDFGIKDVRGALEDILRLGSANIPDLWLSDEEMVEKGLVET